MRTVALAIAAILPALGLGQCSPWHGSLVTDQNIGPDHHSVSRVEATPGATVMGVDVGPRPEGRVILADSFVVDVGENSVGDLIVRFQVPFMEPGAIRPSVTDAMIELWRGGLPGQGGERIYGDLFTNRIISTGPLFDQWPTPVYRVHESDLESTANQIFVAEIGTGGGVGVYNGETLWLLWTLAGPHDVFAPLSTPAAPEESAFQLREVTGGYDYTLVDNNGADPGGDNDLPFKISYACIPEPGSWLALFGGVALLLRRRRRPSA
ncbi:MAG: PEP-CTERM sorting domain-containing protein [Fimbriimonadales bacterium]